MQIPLEKASLSVRNNKSSDLLEGKKRIVSVPTNSLKLLPPATSEADLNNKKNYFLLSELPEKENFLFF